MATENMDQRIVGELRNLSNSGWGYEEIRAEATEYGMELPGEKAEDDRKIRLSPERFRRLWAQANTSNESVQRFVEGILDGEPERPEDTTNLSGDIDAEVEALVADGLATLLDSDANGTRKYDLAIEEPRASATLVIHAPDQPETWDYEGLPWFVELEKFHDRAQNSPAGSELMDIDDAEDLRGWIEDQRS